MNGDDIIVIKLKEQMRLSPAQFENEVNRMSFKHNNILQLKGYCEEIHAGQVRQRLLCYEVFQESLGAMIYGGKKKLCIYFSSSILFVQITNLTLFLKLNLSPS